MLMASLWKWVADGEQPFTGGFPRQCSRSILQSETPRHKLFGDQAPAGVIATLDGALRAATLSTGPALPVRRLITQETCAGYSDGGNVRPRLSQGNVPAQRFRRGNARYYS